MHAAMDSTVSAVKHVHGTTNSTETYSYCLAGEVCYEWVTWGAYFGVTSIAGQSILQSVVYIGLAVCFAGSAAFLVQSYAPYAFHTGIPEIKAILGGLVLDEFLSAWTLLIKALGLALSVGSGLSLGKEGPLVHVSCCMASLWSTILSFTFPSFGTYFQNQSQSQRRKLLAAAATAGVAVAFGSPLGGVLFGLEELDSALFSNQQLMWRAFVTSVVAATTLAYIDPFGIGKLVLFQVTASQQWRQFELVPWLGLGVLGGVLGALLIKLNARVALYRNNGPLRNMKVFEVLIVTAITAVISWPIVFMRDQTSTLVANLFQECEPSKDYHGLCNQSFMWQNMFLLLLTAGLKILLTAWTFGMHVRRIQPSQSKYNLLMMATSEASRRYILANNCNWSISWEVAGNLPEWHKASPRSWIFSSCPPEGTCIYPGFYAVIGAAALLGGVTRMTVSLVVILFELTGALSHVLPIMLAVMSSKFVGDYLGKGVYDTWIAMHGYPYLPPSDFRDRGETAASVMTSTDKLVVLYNDQSTPSELDALLNDCTYSGFPVLEGSSGRLLGYASRYKLRQAIDPLLSSPSESGRLCNFVRTSSVLSDSLDFSAVIDKAPMQMRKEMPLHVVVTTFQRLNLRYILFTSNGGFLNGLLTKRDIARFLNEGFEQANALSEPSENHADWGRF
ncbi:hypothetical protein FS837_001677 [Tulasnella sp. UAMH 9824]|nr:hypothetical protein FS837_001677 [Tulasnella sp. UAMH 9824]